MKSNVVVFGVVLQNELAKLAKAFDGSCWRKTLSNVGAAVAEYVEVSGKVELNQISDEVAGVRGEMKCEDVAEGGIREGWS